TQRLRRVTAPQAGGAISLPISLARIMFRSATRQELISERVRPRLFSKAIQAVDNHTIRIVRTISATTMTPKLNTRIRLSYDCTLSPAVSEIRLVAPAIPLAFKPNVPSSTNCVAKLPLGHSDVYYPLG